MAAPNDERIIPLKIVNHHDFGQRLRDLSLTGQLPDYERQVRSVSIAWLRLAIEHLTEGQRALVSRMPRAAYSRAYYAAYNASKATRFMSVGRVSLHGDDHKKASELPADFPDHAKWGVDITSLYEHRLRADYDNWSNSAKENSLSASDAIRLAERLLQECQTYLSTRFQVRP